MSILKSRVVLYISFILGNLAFVFLLSLLVWASFNTDDVFYSGIGRIVNDNEIPNWSIKYPSPYISFIKVFMICGITYIIFVCAGLIVLLLIARERSKQLEHLRKQKNKKKKNTNRR